MHIIKLTGYKAAEISKDEPEDTPSNFLIEEDYDDNRPSVGCAC